MSDISTDFNMEHSERNTCPIVVTDFSSFKLIDVSSEHLLKNLSPIDVTLLKPLRSMLLTNEFDTNSLPMSETYGYTDSDE